jgi:hypothetical protein
MVSFRGRPADRRRRGRTPFIWTLVRREIARPGALLLALILLPALGNPVGADSFIPKEFDQMVVEAEQIFAGTVSATARSRRLPSGLVVTEVIFSSARVYKGAGGGDVTLLMPGGELGDEVVRVAGMPELRAGTTYLVFAKGNGRSVFPVVGGDQGLFRIEHDPATAEEFVLDVRGRVIENAGIRALAGPAPAGGPAPRILLNTLVEAIRERLRP